MSDAKNTTDGTTLSLSDDDDVVHKKRIKEILDLRHNYIKTRHEVHSEMRTGNLSNSDGVELLKASLDSFLLDVRPIILQSEHSSIWTDEHISTVELQQRRETMQGHAGTEVIVPSDKIEIHGLGELLKINATFNRKWRRVEKHHGQRFNDRVGEVVDQSRLPNHTAVMNSQALDKGFTKASDVLSEIGLDVGLNKNDDEQVNFDYSDLI